MSFAIEQIKNRPIDSNCYVLYQTGYSNCLVIDPGTADCNDLIQFLDEHQLVPQYSILTHEHFDHIWGVNQLKDRYNSKIVCSQSCAEKITNKKKNMSVFYDQVGFETYPADLVIEEIENVLVWNNIRLEFFETRGHTNGSVCILIDNILFTGDTIIRGYKTITKLPGGNIPELSKSIEMISSVLNYPVNCKPGHHNDFIISSKEEMMGLQLW